MPTCSCSRRSSTRRAVAGQYIATYVIANFAAKTAVTPAADGDKVAMWRGSTPGTMTVDVIAAYTAQAVVDDFATVTPAVGTDKVLVNRSSAGKQVLLSDIASYVLTDIQDTVLDFSTITTTSSPATTDVLVLDRSGTPRSCTLAYLETKLWTDFATYAGGLTDAGTVADANKFYCLQSGTPKHCTALEIATYVAAEIWAYSTATLAGTDKFFVYSGSANKTTTLDDIVTYVSTDLQETILDLSSLTEATGVATTDLLLICQGTDPYWIELGDLAAEVFESLPDHVAGLDAVTTTNGTDEMYVLQGGVPKLITIDDIAGYAIAESSDPAWKLVSSGKYTAVPTSTSSIGMNDTSDFYIGLPVKYVYGGNTYYAIVTAVAAFTSITVAGAPLDTGQSVTALYAGLAGNVVEKEYLVDTAWADVAQDIFSAVTYERHRWRGRDACLVAFGAAQGVKDTGANQPKLNVKIAGDLVGTQDGTNGITLSATLGTWEDSSAVAISTANYEVTRGDAIELRCTVAGTNGDADVLSVSLTFVYK